MFNNFINSWTVIVIKTSAVFMFIFMLPCHYGRYSRTLMQSPLMLGIMTACKICTKILSLHCGLKMPWATLAFHNHSILSVFYHCNFLSACNRQAVLNVTLRQVLLDVASRGMHCCMWLRKAHTSYLWTLKGTRFHSTHGSVCLLKGNLELLAFFM